MLKTLAALWLSVLLIMFMSITVYMLMISVPFRYFSGAILATFITAGAAAVVFPDGRRGPGSP